MAKNTKSKKVIYAMVQESFSKEKLDPEKVRKILDVLKKLPKGEAVSALSLYLKLLKYELDQHRLVIEVPMKPSKSQIDEIYKIASKHKKIFDTEIIVNPSLLAGFRFRIGDEVYEDSIENRIEQLREVINE